MSMITKTSSKEQEYKKLLELQNLRNSALETLQKFHRENPYCNRREEQYVKDLLIIKQAVEQNKLATNCKAVSEKFVVYRESLERKYKFEFPVERYGDGAFAEYFKNLMR